MIVPSLKLLFWVCVVFLPFAALLTAVPSTAMLSGCLMAALVILAAVDAVLGRGCLTGISVELPEVVRLSRDRDGEILLSIKNERMKVRQLRLGLAFPKEMYSPNRDLMAELPAHVSVSTLLWPLKVLKCGQYVLDKCYIEVGSPFGLWAIRTTLPINAKVCVYPNLFNERRNLTGLFLNRGQGMHIERQVGKGRDFEQLREYIPGDSYEDIHWKATAKCRRAITKVYRTERAQEVYIIIDASRLSARSTELFQSGRPSKQQEESPHSTTVLDRFLTAALIMELAVEKKGDLIGLLTFDYKVRGFVKARNGKAHYDTCRDLLYTLESRVVAPDFSELFTFIGMQIRRRALLVFLTNLDDPVLAESFIHHTSLISRRHMVLVNMLKPALARPLFSALSVQSVDDIYRDLGGHILWAGLQETEKVLQRRGICFSLLDSEKICAQIVSQYTTIKQRQIL